MNNQKPSGNPTYYEFICTECKYEIHTLRKDHGEICEFCRDKTGGQFNAAQEIIARVDNAPEDGIFSP